MDYKYIEQLLDRYWKCETSVEEERILRAFFCQKDVPASLLPYKELFTYSLAERRTDVLDDDFDSRILALTEGSKAVKARTISLAERLMPLLKAAAIIAMVITVGGVTQIAIENSTPETVVSMSGDTVTTDGKAVAKSDTVCIDTAKKVSQMQQQTIIE